MTGYDWSGLRLWRVAFAFSLLFFLPVSCFVGSVVGPVVVPGIMPGVALGLVLVVGALRGLRDWPCPRCRSEFTKLTKRPWVAPWASVCLQCGLPEFTSNEAKAPPVAAPAPSPIRIAPEAARAISKVTKGRTRVALLFAVPLLYLTMCRLPAGEIVKTPSGREVKMLGIMRNKSWRSGQGTSESVDASYYASAPNDSSEEQAVLSVVIPMVSPSDSIIRIVQVKDNWWVRTFGIRIFRERTFRRQSDGTWAAL